MANIFSEAINCSIEWALYVGCKQRVNHQQTGIAAKQAQRLLELPKHMTEG